VRGVGRKGEGGREGETLYVDGSLGFCFRDPNGPRRIEVAVECIA
jgi:hypothetical protein